MAPMPAKGQSYLGSLSLPELAKYLGRAQECKIIADREYGDRLLRSRARFCSQEDYAKWLEQHDLLDDVLIKRVREGKYLNPDRED